MPAEFWADYLDKLATMASSMDSSAGREKRAPYLQVERSGIACGRSLRAQLGIKAARRMSKWWLVGVKS